MGIVETSQLGPIPIGNWTSDYIDLGFDANGVTVEFPWVGDKLVEWDKDTKEIVWTWSVFDHFSMDDLTILEVHGYLHQLGFKNTIGRMLML